MMQIKDIITEGDANISILQFLKTQSTPEIEIKRLLAGRDISITVNKFFHQSPDFKKLIEKIEIEVAHFNAIPANNNTERLAQGKQLTKLMELEKALKIDVLQLADIFLRLRVTSGRLKQASVLFENGCFKEADDILSFENLSDDQDDMFLAADYWERRMQDIMDGMARVTNSN